MEHIKDSFTVAARTTPRPAPPATSRSISSAFVPAAATKMHGGFDWDEMTKNWRVAVGTPSAWPRKSPAGVRGDSSRVICHHHIGDMPHWKVVKNMTMFAKGSSPHLRPNNPSLNPERQCICHLRN